MNKYLHYAYNGFVHVKHVIYIIYNYISCIPIIIERKTINEKRDKIRIILSFKNRLKIPDTQLSARGYRRTGVQTPNFRRWALDLVYIKKKKEKKKKRKKNKRNTLLRLCAASRAEAEQML